MHHLFRLILEGSPMDLSRAGELFSIPDAVISDDLSEILLQISKIIAQPQFLKNQNDQSVIEICVNRCTSCIRETDSAEKHIRALVLLLSTCSTFNLKPISGEDPPHSKISADIISCIFLNYNKKSVMEQVLPVAVKFLNKDNKEMAKNLSSYLSLAAISGYSYVLEPHIEAIVNSMLGGNYTLARVILQLYELAGETCCTFIIANLRNFIDILPSCEPNERNLILQLLSLIISSNSEISSVMIDKLPSLFGLSLDSSTAIHALILLLKISEQNTSHFHVQDNIGFLMIAAQKNRSTTCLVGQILSTIGQKNKQKAQLALEFIMDNLPNVDRNSQTVLLQEAVKLVSLFPILFSDKLTAVIRQRNLSQHCLVLDQKPFKSQTSTGNVTIVNVNTSSSNIPTTSAANNNSSSSKITSKSLASSTKSRVNDNNSSSTSPIVGLNQQSSNQNINSSSTQYMLQQYVQPRRSKLIDSRSTGRLHNINNASAHRSMSRLNNHNGINNSNQGFNMSRISSSQQINQASSTIEVVPSTICPPLSQHVTIIGENKYGIPNTKITSGGVTVNHHNGGQKIRPFSHIGPLLEQSGSIVKSSDGLSTLNQSSDSITDTETNFNRSNNIVTVMQRSIPSLVTPILEAPDESPAVTLVNPSQISSSAYAKSVTLLNVNNNVNHRMSVFEPSSHDTIQHFCEKHLSKIKKFMKTASQLVPSPAKCTIEERKGKKNVKLYFACQTRGSHCLYSKTLFSMRTRNARLWIHLSFLDLQSRSEEALSSFDSSVASLKHCWDILKLDNRTFITLVTSAFPSVRDQEMMRVELGHSGFFDVFDLSPPDSSVDQLNYSWGCFLCNNPEKAEFLESNTQQPVIEGQLKEKKGKWRIFKRWKTRYFTLSGAHLKCNGASGDASIDINQIRSVKVSRGARNIPTCFEIFTGNQTLILKPTDENAEKWVQYLSIVVARHTQVRDGFNKSNSLPSGSRREINSRTAF